MQADLIGARALGVRNILALTGDPPSLGDNQQSTPVYDVDSIGLVRIIDRFNEGLDLAGQEMGQKGAFTIAVACDPTRADLVQEVDRFHHKVSGGAHFTMTQPIFDPQLWSDFLRVYEERHGRFPVPVLIGVLPLQGHKHATFLHNEVPGITLSEDALERMRLAGPNGRQEGVKMAQELLLRAERAALRAGRLPDAQLWPLRTGLRSARRAKRARSVDSQSPTYPDRRRPRLHPCVADAGEDACGQGGGPSAPTSVRAPNVRCTRLAAWQAYWGDGHLPEEISSGLRIPLRL